MIWVFFLIVINVFFSILFHHYIINKPPNVDFVVGRLMGSLHGHSGFVVPIILSCRAGDVDAARQIGK